MSGENVDWDGIFSIFTTNRTSVDALLMSPEFLDVIVAFYKDKYAKVPFTDFLWTMRSIYLTLFLSLKCDPPQADIYHCVATGYAGIIGSLAKTRYPSSRLIITEHGIYTREREEEIIRAKWVQGIFKDIWIEQFRKMSLCAYQYADKVTALFAQARLLQLELGCPAEKTVVIPNGINFENFENIPGKTEEDEGFFNIGAILRITPIKDVKTMITAFHYANQRNPRLKLWIMGPSAENEEYANECTELVKSLGAKNIVFTGSIKTTEYIGRMDMTLLTSISEGQPLTILESFAAKKPCVATNVGNCYGLIYGESDNYGAAGMVVPIMNIPAITDALVYMAEDENRCREMGEIGHKRVMLKYKNTDMKRAYAELYRELTGADALRGTV